MKNMKLIFNSYVKSDMTTLKFSSLIKLCRSFNINRLEKETLSSSLEVEYFVINFSFSNFGHLFKSLVLFVCLKTDIFSLACRRRTGIQV